MQLAVDSLDRLVEFVEERGGRARASQAAAHLFAVKQAPEGLARSLLGPLVDGDDRLVWRGVFIALADTPEQTLAAATFVVFDLETTGLARASARICEIGAVKIDELEAVAEFQSLVSAGIPLPAPIGRLTGISDASLRGAPGIRTALRRFLAFSGPAILVAHNARFDVGFLDLELGRLQGKRVAATVIDTVPLARNLLRGRVERTNLATLAHFFGTSVRPCHRALPDAQATAEIFLRLVDLAREEGASTVSELEEIAAPRPRRIHRKRRLIHGAPSKPGVYLFYDRSGEVLYVGKARDLNARLRTYFQSSRQRRAVEIALDELERIEWRVAGSELAAALEEVRLIRRLRPRANKLTPEPERYVYLHRRGERVVVSRAPSRYGPLRRPTLSRRAARALKGISASEFESLLDGTACDRARDRLGLVDPRDPALPFLKREVEALGRVLGQLRELDQLRRLETCVVAPSLQPGHIEVFTLSAGRLRIETRVGDRPLPTWDRPTSSADEVDSDRRLDTDVVDELLVLRSFLRRLSPELRVVPLQDEAA